jgi:hypothetical protein
VDDDVAVPDDEKPEVAVPVAVADAVLEREPWPVEEADGDAAAVAVEEPLPDEVLEPLSVADGVHVAPDECCWSWK